MDIENIAITGVSGRFPNADSIEEFKGALLNNVDLITDGHNRWPYDSLKTPPSMGIVEDFENFDASFFEINPKSAELHDPRGRKLLEVVFESIVDAGFNPNELKGSNTGVYVGIMQNSLDYDYLRPGSGINSTTYIIANNISYIFDFHGPSSGVDTGCSSSIYAINQAVESMRLGVCDAAVVCSAHANFLPHDSVEFSRLGVLNPEGRCRTFDDDRNGYVKSEAVVAIFLQMKQDARRIYATISGIGCNVDGYKEDGLLHPSSRMQIALLRDVYSRYKINPDDVAYVDCHGTGTLVGDIEECQGLSDFFTNGKRSSPLQVGSVKTNVGHTEAAGGLVSLIKILIAVQEEVIPANLHFKTPASDIPAIFNSKLKVVSQNTGYKGGLLAINSFGLGGANGHLIIKPYPKTQHMPEKDISEKYRLVLVSGRTETAVATLLNKINENRDQEGFLTLIDNIFATDVKNHSYRGYSIGNGTKQCISRYSTKRPVWFSYSGMGSQWPQMGRGLIHFEVFRKTLKQCAKAVECYGLDLEDIVLNGTTEMFDDPINCFTSIVAVSVALTDLLFSLGIKPDAIIGHSLGEIGCAYGDGLMTAQQATLMAYARGWAIKNTNLIPGLMASVGLSAEECEKLLPAGINIACDNSINNVTVSGPEEPVRLFAEQLTSKGIFVRIVNTANIAFHSRYVKDVGPKLLGFLKEINLEPKRRRVWLPSAVPEDQWESDLGKYNSVEYQCHNFLNKVLYNQVLSKVPKDVILIEVAPCGLFQAIFRRALDPSITKLHLVKKNSENNREFFLDTIGRFYLDGGQPILNNFYKHPEYPLGPDTPMISPLIKWNHVVKWPIPKYDPSNFFGKKVAINVASRENRFLLGHAFNGKNTFPAAGYITLVWETFANMMGANIEDTPVIIEKLKLFKATFLPKNDNAILTVNILKTGTFEISDKVDVVATGKISAAKTSDDDTLDASIWMSKKITTEIKLNKEDIYSMLYLRGYEYGGLFKGVNEVDYTNKTALVKWNKNWTTFLDSMLQTIVFAENLSFMVPKEISRIAINPVFLKRHLEKGQMSLKYGERCVICKGAKISNISWSKMSVRRKRENVTRMKFSFVPNMTKYVSDPASLGSVLEIILQIVIENNLTSNTLKIAELDRCDGPIYKNLIKKLIHPKYLQELVYCTIKHSSLNKEVDYNLVILSRVEESEEFVNFLKNISEDTFIYSEITNTESNFLRKFNLAEIFKRKSSKKIYTLWRKSRQTSEDYTTIKLSKEICSRVKEVIEETGSKILLIDESQGLNETGYFNYINENVYITKSRIIYIKDKLAEQLNLHSPFYQDQLKKDLVINVLQDNEWGTYRSLSVEDQQKKNVDSCFVSLIDNKFQWVQENPYRFKDNRVNVYYCSLDFWDKSINHRTNEDLCLGLDYSGITESGNKVMGLSPIGSLRTHVGFHEYFTWCVPKGWSMKDAATVPFAYTMSYYGLFIKGHLQSHYTILISYNGSSIDVAAINLIMNTNCTILIAVTSQKQSKLLTRCFPKLKHNIIDFSNSNHQDIILLKTHRKGVDIVFNSGEDDVLKSALNIIKYEGRIIDIHFAKKTIPSDSLDIILEKNCVFHTLTLDSLFREHYYILENIRNAIQNYMKAGIIKSFYTDVVDMIKINKLLENFNGTTTNGKITVKICDNVHNKMFLAHPRTYLDPDKSYVVLANLDFFDLEVINWLSDRGAKKILVNSCEGNISGCATLCLENLKKKGDNVMISSFDTTCIEQVEELVGLAATLGEIGGIFELVRESNNRLINRLLCEKSESKYHSTKNIDTVSRKMCKTLDYFVIFSSLQSKLDYPGQMLNNYINTAVESVCENRIKENLPALAIRWGPIEELSSTSQLKGIKRDADEYPQSTFSCLETLDTFMHMESGVYSSTLCRTNEEVEDLGNFSITGCVAKIFGIKNVDQIDPRVPLINLGMDSIMGFEMKEMLHRQFGVSFSVNEIRKLNLEGIKKMEETKKTSANS